MSELGLSARMQAFLATRISFRRFESLRSADARGVLVRFARLMRIAGLSVGLKAGSVAMTFAITIIVARTLSASGVGVYALAGLSATIGAIAVSAGFDALALKLGARDCARRTQRRLRHILTIFALVLPGSALVATGLVAGLLASYGFELRSMLAPVAVQTIAVGAYRVVGSAVQARGGIVLSQIGELTVRPAFVLALTSWAQHHDRLSAQQLLWIMAAGATACLVYILLIYFVISGRASRAKLRLPPRKLITGLAMRAPSYAGFFVVVLLIEQIDILLLGILRGEAEAGFYQPAARIAWLASLGGVAISIIGRPQIARAAADRDHERIGRLMSAYRAASLIFFAGASLFLINFSEQIFQLFGRDYQNASVTVFILLILHGGAACVGPVDAAAQVLGSGASILARSLISLGVFLITGLLLIPPFGAHGAAIAAVIGGLIYRLSFFLFVQRCLSEFRTRSRTSETGAVGGA